MKINAIRLPPVIGLCGPAGAGKSYAAELLKSDLRYHPVNFADPLKCMMSALRLVPEDALFGSQAAKEAPRDALCGKSARQAMQTLGTEWGRQCVGEHIWVNAWSVRAAYYVNDCGLNVVAADVRFDNEVHAVRALGGVVIRVEPVKEHVMASGAAHVSEAGVVDFDAVVVNGFDGTFRRALALAVNRALVSREAVAAT